MKITFYAAFASACFLFLSACTSESDTKKLPFLGEKEPISRIENGVTVVDTVPHTIPAFSFTNQYGDTITEKFVENKIYLVDFFFIACPTICPRVKKNMLKVFETLKKDPDVVILSHTIDPRHDTTAALLAYAEKLHIACRQWQFLTGNRDSLYKMAGQYLVAAQEETTAAGGFTHSGNVMLIDKHRRIRGYYDGMKTEQLTVDLLRDLAILKKEE